MSLESRERGVRIDPATGLPFPPMLVRFTQILARVPRWRAAVWDSYAYYTTRKGCSVMWIHSRRSCLRAPRGG